MFSISCYARSDGQDSAIAQIIEGDSISSPWVPNADGVRPSWTGQWPLLLKSKLPDFVLQNVVAQGSSRVLTDTVTKVDGIKVTAKSMMWRYKNIVHATAPYNTGMQGVYLILGGVNDIRYDNLGYIDAMNIYSGLREIWGQARLDGFKVIAFKLLPFSDGLSNKRKQRVWLELNNLISSDQDAYDCLVDFSKEPLLSDSYNMAIFADNIHLSALGDSLLAELVKKQCLSTLVPD